MARRPRPGGGRRVIATRAESTLGRGTNTVCRHLAHDAGVGPVGDLDADCTIGHGSRAGSEAFGHLPLHHHEHPIDRRHPIEEVGDERRGDVVRQVGDEHPVIVIAEEVRPVDRHRVGFDHRDPVELAHHVGERPHQTVVDLDGGDVGARLGEGQGERPQTGADLDDVVAGPDRGEVGDAPHGVRIGDEVLTEITARRQAAAGQQIAHGGPRRHWSTVALSRVSERSERAANNGLRGRGTP